MQGDQGTMQEVSPLQGMLIGSATLLGSKNPQERKASPFALG